MIRVTDVIAVPVRSGFFRDDQARIVAGAAHDGFLYEGDPLTPGFTAVREAGQALSILLVLEDGRTAVGDCAEVQYPGVGGRDPVFDSLAAQEEVERIIAPVLIGREIDGFRGIAGRIDALPGLSTPVRYGISQALLSAAAQGAGMTMAELIRDEYATGIRLTPVPLYAQSGDERYTNVDKMILKRVDALPHGLINDREHLVGPRGELLLEYVAWVRNRILHLADDDYVPTIHLDLYGTIGLAFDGSLPEIAGFLERLGRTAAPFPFRAEHPLDAGGRSEQIAAFAQLRALLAERGSDVQVVADEWCNTLDDIRAFIAGRAADMIHVKTPDLGGLGNTIDALLEVRRAGLGAFCGGTCNETDVSAIATAHVAMAVGADQLLAKPGMGVDEGVMVVGNEMARVTALAKRRTFFHS